MEVDVNQPDWERLVKKNRWHPLFYTQPRVELTVEGLRLAPGFGRYVCAFILFLLGGGMWAACYFFWSIVPAFVHWFGLGFGAILLWPAVYYVFMTNQVVWRRFSPTISIQYGMAPFSRTVELPRDGLQAVLDADKLAVGGVTGEVVLAISQKGAGDETRIRLAAGNAREQLIPAFNALRDALGAGTDDSLREVTLPGGRKARIEPVSLRSAGANFATTKLIVRSSDLAVCRPSTQARLFWMAFLVFGVGLSISIVPWTGDFSLDDLFPVLFGVVFGGVGLAALLNARRFVFDRRTGLLAETKGAFGWYRRIGERKLDDIEAVQLCSRYQSGGEAPAYMVYQINLVFAGPGDDRLNLTSHAGEKQVRAEAEVLAGFLGKPLLDHTLKDDTPKNLGQFISAFSNHWKKRR